MVGDMVVLPLAKELLAMSEEILDSLFNDENISMLSKLYTSIG